jgi:hypothetical protein
LTVDQILIPLASALIGGAVGSTFTYYFSVRRDIAVKRREIILDNLVQALKEINKSSKDRPDTDLKQLENVVFRVQMVGEESLVDLANKLILELVETKNANLTPLYLELRKQVRRELRLKPIPDQYMSLVIRNPGDKGFAEVKTAQQSKTQ